MVSSFQRISGESYSSNANTARRRAILDEEVSLTIRMALILMIFALPMIFAPESPEQEASICLRNHSIEACQIW